MADHRKLKVWQLAQDVAVVIWRETRRWETDLSVATIRQIRASSESISANIAEGNGRSPREFNRYLTIALGSANETDSHLVMLMHRAAIDLRIALQLRDDIMTIRRMIIALQRTLQ
jgi:four helix bundle protein